MPVYILVLGHISEDAVQRTDTHHFMRWNSQAVRTWLVRLQDDMTANLINLCITPVAAESCHKLESTQVSGKFHPRASISSRTK